MTIQELIAELENAKSPSFVLDGQIQSVLLPDREGMMPPNYSASVDATVRLADAILLGWSWTVYGKSHAHGPRAVLVNPDTRIQVGESGATPVLALLIAILKAKQAQEEMA